MTPRSAGSWPGVVFTGAPLKLASGHFGMGYGTGAHAPDEFFLIDSTNPAIAGMDDAALSFVRFLYQVAATDSDQAKIARTWAPKIENGGGHGNADAAFP